MVAIVFRCPRLTFFACLCHLETEVLFRALGRLISCGGRGLRVHTLSRSRSNPCSRYVIPQAYTITRLQQSVQQLRHTSSLHYHALAAIRAAVPSYLKFTHTVLNVMSGRAYLFYDGCGRKTKNI